MLKLRYLLLVCILSLTMVSCLPSNNSKIVKTTAKVDKITGLNLPANRQQENVRTNHSRLLPRNEPVIIGDNPDINTEIPKLTKEDKINQEAPKIGVLLFPVDIDYTQYYRQQQAEDAFKALAETGLINPIFEIPTMEDLNFSEDSSADQRKSSTTFSQRAFESASKLCQDPDIELIVGAGEPVCQVLVIMATQFSKKHFLLLDVAEPSLGRGLPNVKSIRCKVEEAAFLCGILAVHNTAGGSFGFVGYRLDQQTLAYYAGFRAGAKHARPGAIVNYSFIENPYSLGSFPPVEATTKKVYELIRNNDMIFENAGMGQILTLKACVDLSKRAFASVSNKDSEFARTVITSAMVNYGPLVQSGLASSIGESFTPGRVEWGLNDGVVGITDMKTIRRYLDLSDDGLKAVDQAYADITNGQIMVPKPTEELQTRIKRDITEQQSAQAR